MQTDLIPEWNRERGQYASKICTVIPQRRCAISPSGLVFLIRQRCSPVPLTEFRMSLHVTETPGQARARRASSDTCGIPPSRIERSSSHCFTKTSSLGTILAHKSLGTHSSDVSCCFCFLFPR